jgi:hypothetical protein
VTNDEPAEERVEAGGSRRLPRPAVIVLVAAVALAVAGAVAGVVLPAERITGSAAMSRPPADPSTALGRQCLAEGGRLQLTIRFPGARADDEMRVAADALRDDPRAARVLTETRDEAFARFKKIFADQPDMLELVRPESMPAAIEVLTVDDVDPAALAADLPAEVVGELWPESCLLPGKPGIDG